MNALKLQIASGLYDVTSTEAMPPARRGDQGLQSGTNLSALVRKVPPKQRSCQHCIPVNRQQDALGHWSGGGCLNRNLLATPYMTENQKNNPTAKKKRALSQCEEGMETI